MKFINIIGNKKRAFSGMSRLKTSLQDREMAAI
jgi:hypothetical protein